MKQIAKANGYQLEEVDRVIGRMSARKSKQNATVRTSPKQNGMPNYCLENTAMMTDTPAEQPNRNSKHSTQSLPPGGNLRSNWKLCGQKRKEKKS